MRRVLLSILLLMLALLPASAQQSYVNRVGIFTGFSYLSTPSINLNQRGFNGSAGINVNRWLELGADFGAISGSTNIVLRKTKLASALPTTLPAPVLAAVLNAAAPADAKTYTFAAGPQLNLRKFEKITFFARPGLGLFHHTADINEAPLATLAAMGISLPGISAHMSDTVPFYGVGGGFDLEASRHFGFRFAVDLVHANPFSNVLHAQNELRVSIGPKFRFGELKTK
jgi:hypothetical protein